MTGHRIGVAEPVRAKGETSPAVPVPVDRRGSAGLVGEDASEVAADADQRGGQRVGAAKIDAGAEAENVAR